MEAKPDTAAGTDGRVAAPEARRSALADPADARHDAGRPARRKGYDPRRWRPKLSVSEAALYRHFASKAQMFEGLIEFIESTIFAHQRHLHQGVSGVKQVRQHGDNACSTCARPTAA